ncbi:MAG: hypothetical protein ABUJ92_15810, partial [Desulfobacterales bacterium]
KIDWFILTERSHEKIVFLGDFKGVDEIIICDNPLFDNCNFKNKQKIILLPIDLADPSFLTLAHLWL